MAAGVARAAATGLPAYLETTNPDNVDLYRRAGWQLTQTVTMETLTVWVMTHGPLDPGGRTATATESRAAELPRS